MRKLVALLLTGALSAAAFAPSAAAAPTSPSAMTHVAFHGGYYQPRARRYGGYGGYGGGYGGYGSWGLGWGGGGYYRPAAYSYYYPRAYVSYGYAYPSCGSYYYATPCYAPTYYAPTYYAPSYYAYPSTGCGCGSYGPRVSVSVGGYWR